MNASLVLIYVSNQNSLFCSRNKKKRKCWEKNKQSFNQNNNLREVFKRQALFLRPRFWEGAHFSSFSFAEITIGSSQREPEFSIIFSNSVFLKKLK